MRHPAFDDTIEPAADAAFDAHIPFVDGTDCFDDALLFEDTTPVLVAEFIGNFAQIGSWKMHAAHIGHQAAHIRQAGHLNGVFGAVEKGSEHLGVIIPTGKSIHPGDVVGICLPERSLETGALARGYNSEAERTGPIPQLEGERGFVAVCSAVNYPCLSS